jgi:hypothetical protein
MLSACSYCNSDRGRTNTSRNIPDLNGANAASVTDGSFYAGSIVEHRGVYLIQFDKVEEPEDHPLPPMELYALEELCRTCEDCGQKLANLFKTCEDMMRWIAWLNEPEKPAGQSGKVVHLKKPH